VKSLGLGVDRRGERMLLPQREERIVYLNKLALQVLDAQIMGLG
jgi:hypothetical protein